MMVCRSAERGHIAEICLNTQRPQVLEHWRIGKVAETFLPQKGRPEAGVTRRLDAGIAGRQLDLHSYRGQELVLLRIVKCPLREHRETIEALHARRLKRRYVHPSAAAADAESRHVV